MDRIHPRKSTSKGRAQKGQTHGLVMWDHNNLRPGLLKTNNQNRNFGFFPLLYERFSRLKAHTIFFSPHFSTLPVTIDELKVKSVKKYINEKKKRKEAIPNRTLVQ